MDPLNAMLELETTLAKERRELASERAKARALSEASGRAVAVKASAAAEREALAIARERGLEQRHEVLDALALTLDANAKRLADEEARVVSSASEAEDKARRLARQAHAIEDAEAEQRATARWLRREASRCEAEDKSRKAQIDDLERSAKEKAAELEAKARLLETRDGENATVRARLSEGESVMEAREAACASREKEVAEARAAVDDEKARLEAVADALDVKAADVDARAHSVAAADAVARDRLEALTKRAEALADARAKVEERARAADKAMGDVEVRLAQLEEREAVTREAEERARVATDQAAREAKDIENKRIALSEARAAERAAAVQEGMKAQESLEATKRDVDASTAALEAEKLALEQLKTESREAKAQADAARLALDEARLETKNRDSALASRVDAIEASEADVLARLQAAERREAEATSAKQEADRCKSEFEAKDGDVERTKLQLSERLAAVESREKDAKEREAYLEERRCQPTWLTARSLDAEWESIEWLRSVARTTSEQQAAAHEAVKAAVRAVRKVPGDASKWGLLPREVRASLRAGVELGDAVRLSCADLHAALVRRFLRLCAGAGTATEDAVLREALGALRGIAAQEIVRRKALVTAIYAARYANDQTLATDLDDRPAPRSAFLFKLQKNNFDSLRLRLPAARARFAAATAHWAADQVRRLLFDVAKRFNGYEGGVATPDSRVFFAPRDAHAAGLGPPRVELRFDDDGDDGRHAPRAACVFDTPRDLLAFFKTLDEHPRLNCLGLANGFKRASASDDDETTDPPHHEVAVALDIHKQGVLCDLRLRLRALEAPQRHLGSLRFLADVDTHEEILLPLWTDVSHSDAWIQHLAAGDASAANDPPPPPYDRPPSSRSHLAFRESTASDWPAPPNWQRTY